MERLYNLTYTHCLLDRGANLCHGTACSLKNHIAICKLKQMASPTRVSRSCPPEFDICGSEKSQRRRSIRACDNTSTRRLIVKASFHNSANCCRECWFFGKHVRRNVSVAQVDGSLHVRIPFSDPRGSKYVGPQQFLLVPKEGFYAPKHYERGQM